MTQLLSLVSSLTVQMLQAQIWSWLHEFSTLLSPSSIFLSVSHIDSQSTSRLLLALFPQDQKI
jgi:hypothetical protein